MKIHSYKIIIGVSVLLLLVISLFCINYNNSSRVTAENGTAYFKSSYDLTKTGTFKMTYKGFYGSEVRSFTVIKGNKIKLSYNSSVRYGALNMCIKDAYGNVLFSLPSKKRGSLIITAKVTEQISIVVAGTNSSGSFKISWRRLLF